MKPSKQILLKFLEVIAIVITLALIRVSLFKDLSMDTTNFILIFNTAITLLLFLTIKDE